MRSNDRFKKRFHGPKSVICFIYGFSRERNYHSGTAQRQRC